MIAEPCIGTKDTACVDACPVDCIHPKKDDPKFDGEQLIYIDPVECIDCGACVPVCPVSAIFMGKDYELAVYSNKDFIWDKADMLVPPKSAAPARVS